MTRNEKCPTRESRGKHSGEAATNHQMKGARPVSHNLSLVGGFGESPFDAIRHIADDGAEWWSARDLMPLLGYTRWDHFEIPINRAIKSAANQGHAVDQHFPGSRKVANSGPSASDYRLTRFGAYLVAMNGDPNKAEVAAAQSYFAIKTRQAEVALVETDEMVFARGLVAAPLQLEVPQ